MKTQKYIIILIMHIYVAGLGGAGLGPLAEMAHQLGYRVSGSDLKNSKQIDEMRIWQPEPIINIGQTAEQIAATHADSPIDWYVYSSSLEWARPPNAELMWVKNEKIKHSKRDEFLNHLFEENHLKLLAVTGSHGKTTTTALVIWLLGQLQDKISYSLGGKLIGLPAANIEKQSEWFVYEADEFDRNFLSFKPQLSLITGIDHDHPETYPTKKDYFEAFLQFINQSQKVLIGKQDFERLYGQIGGCPENVSVIQTKPAPLELTLTGEVNRQNATLALAAVKILKPSAKDEDLIAILNKFPGSWRRFEEIAPNLYTDYAHNPVKIAGCLQIASELKKPVIVIYEPHSNQRQHLVRDQYRYLFKEVERVYWLPSFLTREDPRLKVLTPLDLIAGLDNPQVARASKLDDELKRNIKDALKSGAIVVGMSASGLDDWLRTNFADKKYLKF